MSVTVRDRAPLSGGCASSGACRGEAGAEADAAAGAEADAVICDHGM